MSSTNDDDALRRYMDQIRRHLSRYCVSLASSRVDMPSARDWMYATGILLTIDGQMIIATAGHWASEVHRWKDSGNLREIQIRYNHISDELIPRRIEAAAITSTSLPVADDFDAAFLRLPPDIANDVEAQDNHFFTRASFASGLTQVCHLVLVCGYPVQANVITETPSLVLPTANGWVQHNMVGLGSLAFQSTLLAMAGEPSAFFPVGFDCDADEFALRPLSGRINSRPESGVTSASGMSGGPVLMIVVDAQNAMTFFEPRLLGMQYSQRAIERRDSVEITQLNVVGGMRLLQWIETTL